MTRESILFWCIVIGIALYFLVACKLFKGQGMPNFEIGNLGSGAEEYSPSEYYDSSLDVEQPTGYSSEYYPDITDDSFDVGPGLMGTGRYTTEY